MSAPTMSIGVNSHNVWRAAADRSVTMEIRYTIYKYMNAIDVQLKAIRYQILILMAEHISLH
jgi:hypothetical protein